MADTVFNERLVELMEQEPKTTRADLAEVLGVTRQSIGSYISGNTKPSPKVLVTLAKYFGVSTDYLLGVEKTKVFRKGGMPRICSVIGMKVGEPFRFMGGDEILRITCFGEIICGNDQLCSSQMLAAIINNPSAVEPVQKKLRLSRTGLGEKELGLLLPVFRDMNVHWVTMDDTRAAGGQGEQDKIVFWSRKPHVDKAMEKKGCIVYDGDFKVGFLLAKSYPYFRPGACFYVRDLLPAPQKAKKKRKNAADADTEAGATAD